MNTEEMTIVAKAAYEKAKETEAAAKASYEALKASQEPVKKAYLEAKAAYDGLTPALNLAKAQVQKANADVTITRSEYAKLAPKEVAGEKKQGTGNKGLLEAVSKILAANPDGLSNGEIFDALEKAGVEMAGEKARDNLNAYLSRWGQVKAGGIVSKGIGKWGVENATAVPPAPAFLGGTDATPPAAVAPVEVTQAPEAPPAPVAPVPDFLAAPAASTSLTADFPGFEPLAAAGITTKEALVGKTKDDLTAIAGIGAKTADKILEALAA